MSTEKLEFDIDPKTGQGLRTFFYSQLFCTSPSPNHSFANQTVIVTGSNVGLGLEAARHFYRLDCARLILAVRTLSKGHTAKEDIVQSITQRADTDAIEVWALDLSSTESTLAFADRVRKELPRVDVVVENAGINNRTWATSEGFEQTIQVNVINTFLLAISLLPNLTETKEKFGDSSPHLVIVSSEARSLIKFREINAPDLYEHLNDERFFEGPERYGISKLLEVLLVREIVSRLQKSNSAAQGVVVNLVSPGLCKSELDRRAEVPLVLRAIIFIARLILERKTDVGARTFVLAAYAGPDSHGEFQSDGKNQVLEPWHYDDVGRRVREKVFEQTMRVLRTRKPGLGEDIGL